MSVGAVAHRSEQAAHNHLVDSSTLSSPTNIIECKKPHVHREAFCIKRMYGGLCRPHRTIDLVRQQDEVVALEQVVLPIHRGNGRQLGPEDGHELVHLEDVGIVALVEHMDCRLRLLDSVVRIGGVEFENLLEQNIVATRCQDDLHLVIDVEPGLLLELRQISSGAFHSLSYLLEWNCIQL
jgi:hypothetical protein